MGHTECGCNQIQTGSTGERTPKEKQGALRVPGHPFTAVCPLPLQQCISALQDIDRHVQAPLASGMTMAVAPRWAKKRKAAWMESAEQAWVYCWRVRAHVPSMLLHCRWPWRALPNLPMHAHL